MGLREYKVLIGEIEHTLQLDEDDARKLGVLGKHAEVEAVAPTEIHINPDAPETGLAPVGSTEQIEVTPTEPAAPAEPVAEPAPPVETEPAADVKPETPAKTSGRRSASK